MPKARTAEVDLSRLCDAIRASRKALEPFRAERREAVRKYAGDHYSTETSRTPRPINFLSLYLQIVSRNLISHDPRVELTTFEKQYKAVVTAMEGWCNREVVRMGLAETLQRVVLDALFSVGITKVALASPAESEMSGWNLSAGQPFAERIDLDDWVFDAHARDFSEAAFEGHRVRVRLDTLKDSKLYDPIKRKLLQPNRDRQFNESGDERVSMLQRQYVSNDMEEAYDYVDLWEIYLPREKLVVCLFSEDGGAPSPLDFKGDDAPFYEKPWVGPDCGPYHHLKYMTVPGNAMPKGPVQDLIDMDEALNALTQKLIEQAARQKEVLAASGAADTDGQRIVDARDGEVIRVDNVEKLKPMGFGGPHASNQQFSLGLWELLNKIGGNLELMGGLGQQSRTATQDKLLNANSGRSVQDMQQVTVHHTADVIRSLAWFYHHHPQKVMTSYHDVAGLDNPLKRQVTPAQRQQVPFEALEVKVDPYSLQYQTPQDRLAFLNNVVTQIVSPLMPLMQQQGIYFDMAKYLEMVGQYGNSPDLTEIITTGQPPPTDGGSPDEPAKPQTTQRTYNRVNQSEGTSGGQSKAMQQALAGQAAGGRPSSNGTYSPVAR